MVEVTRLMWRRQIAALTAEFARLDEEAQLQSFGFYKPWSAC